VQVYELCRDIIFLVAGLGAVTGSLCAGTGGSHHFGSHRGTTERPSASRQAEQDSESLSR